LSTVLYSKISFINELSFLSASYKKTLSLTHLQDSTTNPIKESLAQMKVLLTVFSKLLMVVLPFIMMALFLIWDNISIKSEIFKLQNNLLMLFTFFITKFTIANGK